jgi:WD40 repeat protein
MMFMFQTLMLGVQGDRSHASVTSMCFNQQGDLLLAGYGDGHITVWDIQRSSAAKVITGEHTSPIVHTLFLGQDSQVTRQFKAVTGDSKGLVLLHAFSVVPLLNRFTIKTQVKR